MTSPLTIPEIEAAIDTIVEHRNSVLRGKSPYNPGDIRKIEDDLRDLRRIWSEIGSEEAIKAIKRENPDDDVVKFRPRQMPDWLREHEKIT